jgi:hypothetical protein
MEEIGVKTRQGPAEYRACSKTDRDPDGSYKQHEFEVMPRNRRSLITDCLQEADLLALERNEARKRDVDQERCDRKKDWRHDPRQRCELL